MLKHGVLKYHNLKQDNINHKKYTTYIERNSIGNIFWPVIAIRFTNVVNFSHIILNFFAIILDFATVVAKFAIVVAIKLCDTERPLISI
jgi:hypothetical protein